MNVWLPSRYLLLNETKTEPALFSAPKNRVPQPPPLSINICGFNVSTSINIHDLGVQLDPTMSMATYVSRTCRSAYAHLRGKARIRSSLPLRVRKSLYTRLSRHRLSLRLPLHLPPPLSLWLRRTMLATTIYHTRNQ